MEFDLPKEQSSIIKVIGVGGGGSNAVNYMFTQGIRGVNFVVCNTDAQALENSPIPNKIQLGPFLTEGLGAGADPEIGKHAAEESIEEIKRILEKNTKMVFVTAGMGGGTGTGAAPVIAKIAKEMGILTIGIVTKPFKFEGTKRIKNSTEGIESLRQHVDSLIVISNDKVLDIFKNCKKTEAFGKANDILAIGARSTSEIITQPGDINVDFADVKSVMKDSGVALMGCALAQGEQRALKAVTEALNSPLLDNNKIAGAKKVLINIIGGIGDFELTMAEIGDINEYVQNEAGELADLFLGTSNDENLGENISVTVIATGFENIQKNTSPHILSTNTFNNKNNIESTLPFFSNPTQIQEENSTIIESSHPIDVEKSEENITPEITHTKLQLDTDKNQEHQNFETQNVIEESLMEEKTASSNNKPNEIELYTAENIEATVAQNYSDTESNEEEKNNNEVEFKITQKDQAQAEPNPSEFSTPPNLFERSKHLERLNKQLNNPGIYEELEKVSAYKRKNIQLESDHALNLETMSSLKLQNNADGTNEIRTSNSYFNNKPD